MSNDGNEKRKLILAWLLTLIFMALGLLMAYGDAGGR